MAKKNPDAVDKIFQKTLDSVAKISREPFYDLDAVEKTFGVTRYLSTGLPNFDLMLLHNEDRSEYGIPYGRVTEIHGESESNKTWFILDLLARNLKIDGLSYLVKSEMDIDKKFCIKFMQDNGVDLDIAMRRLGIKPALTIKDLYETVKGIIEPLKAVADEIRDAGGVPLEKLPPTVIVCDSLGAMLGDSNRDRLDKDWDKGDQMGSVAKEIHDFFKFFLYDFARLGICFIFTNHYRANLQSTYGGPNPAHDAATKYYATLRMGLNRRSNSNSKWGRSQNYKDYKWGYPLDVYIYKIRGEFVLEGKTRLEFHYNHGFDYLDSLFEAMQMTGIVKKKGRSYHVEFPEDSDFAELNDKYSSKKLKNLLKDDLELAVKIENECYRIGPDLIMDKRSIDHYEIEGELEDEEDE